MKRDSKQRYVVVDFETYYDQLYSLKRMTPVQYILDPRFEVTGCAVCEGDDGPASWLNTEDLPAYFASKADHAFVSHNALFDMSILSWHFGIKPILTIDTMAMARARVAAFTTGVSLAKVSAHFGLGFKTDALTNAIGLRRDQIRTSAMWPAYTAYAINDAVLCREIYKRLRVDYPLSELLVGDMVTRMVTSPGFVLDRDTLALHANQIAADKQALLDRVGLSSRDDLMSNEKFASALRHFGVDPPMKSSPTTGMAIYAFAKSDAAMAELEGHPDEGVQALVAARLGHKSTLEETRTARFQAISNLDWKGRELPLSMPIPLRYSGAHTHRFCLVGETIIVVLRDNLVVQVRLDALLPTDLVWDGDWFVKHGGLAYAGRKYVISHDGVTGTPDHRVWTVELGYCPLETAKARGYDIVRGGLPDASRIDPTMLRTNPVQDTSEVYLQPLRAGSSQHVEGPTVPGPGVVQILRGYRPDAGGVTLQGNVGGCSSEQQSRGREAEGVAGSGSSPGGGIHPGEYAVSGPEVGTKVGPGGLARDYGNGKSRVSEVHEPAYDAVRVLRRQGHRRGLCVDGSNGRLDTDQLGPTPVWHDVGPDGHQRALRTGEPAMGDVVRTDDQPQLVETWDIVDCGPRNRFMANGRIVHNSGDWNLNAQNLGKKSLLRKALCAPPGYKVVTGDAAQIEARLNAVVSGQKDLVEDFRAGVDVYSQFAAEEIYNRPVSKKTDPSARFVGKTSILSLGYQSGWHTFQNMIRVQSRQQLNTELLLPDVEAQNIVTAYRRRYSDISKAWGRLQNMLLPLATKDSRLRLGPMIFRHQYIQSPGGLHLYYHDLKQETTDGQTRWQFTYQGKTKELYGGKVLENCIQHLARLCNMDAAVRLRKRWHPDIARFVLQVHDELVYVVRDDAVKDFRAELTAELAAPPWWAPDAPLASEVNVGQSYGDAK